MPVFYNYTENGAVYSFDDVFVPADAFGQGNLWSWGRGNFGQLGDNTTSLGKSTPVTTFAGGTNWKQVSGGGYFTAAIKTDGTLWSWGQNTNGRLGDNTIIPRSTPVTTFAGGANWKQVAAGREHIAAIKTDGTLWTWGFNSAGQLGDNTTVTKSTPVTTFAGGTNWKQVFSSTAYYGTVAAIKTDGTLWTWGYNNVGQLGDNTKVTKSTPVTTFAGGTNWKQVSSGYAYTAAIKTDGTLWTWGNNGYAKLGTNDKDARITPVTTYAGGTNWKQVSCGYYHATAIKTDGTLWTWGRNNSGQLGRNPDTLLIKLTPVTTFAGGTNWADTATGQPEELYTLSGGYSHTAAIKTDGTLWTWGYNVNDVYLYTNGQLGDNSQTLYRPAPVTTFLGGTNWKQVNCGRYHTASIKTDGTLWTWGRNTEGQLGDNTLITRSTPVTTFTGGTNWKQVACGGYHTTAIKTDGTLWSWGVNNAGQVGSANLFETIPVTTFAGGTNWKQVACGRNHTAAIKTDGTLWTWGYNSSGQLGDNKNTSGPGIEPSSASIPTNYVPGTNWKQIDPVSPTIFTLFTGYYAGAIKTDGTLWTWGQNSYGQLGTNDGNQYKTPVTTFAGGTNWKQVSGGYSHTAAIKTDGTLWTWGENSYGQLGTNDGNQYITPVTTFAGGTNWKQVACGREHTSAIKTDGTLWTWGFNSAGQLGTNDGNQYITPVTTFAGGTNWKQVFSSTAYYGTVAAIKTDGTLWTWGYNNNGQLGDNTLTTRSTPVTTFAGGTNWKQVSGGYAYTAAIKTDGTLWTWGYNNTGQLGDNTLTTRSTPVTTFAGGTNWKQVAGGYNHTAAIKTDGTLWTWGFNTEGQLGDNTTVTKSTPVTTFAGGTNWDQVSARFNSTIATKTDGILWIWGDNYNHQLAYSNLITPVTTFAGGTNWKQVASGYAHTAAIKTDGTLWIWGLNTNAQLGDNAAVNRSTPVTTFAGGTNWSQVTCAVNHTGAVKTDGTLWTWGYNSSGQLGDNTVTQRNTPVTTFAGGTNWKQVACGDFHTAALSNDGTNKILYLWGRNSEGQLGTYWISTDIQILQTFAGGTNWKKVSGGYFQTAAIKTDGTLWTWGLNGYGQLGDNTGTNRSTPVTTFAGGTNWKQVSCGNRHLTAVTYIDSYQ